MKKGIYKECIYCKRRYYTYPCHFKDKKYCSKRCHYDSMKGQKQKPETIEKHRLKMLGHFVSEETRKKIGLKHRGYHHTEEAKRKLSIAHTGKTLSEEHRKKIGRKKFFITKEDLINNYVDKKLSLKNVGNIFGCADNTIKYLMEEFKIPRRSLSESGKGKIFPKELYPKMGWRTSRKNQIFPIKDTSIEVKIQNLLKQLNIEFFTHQYMHIEHGYQCDILIPSKNLVIECDGNYWHKYPTRTKTDNIRTKELLEKGFKVLRLWESEIKIMELNDFQKLIWE